MFPYPDDPAYNAFVLKILEQETVYSLSLHGETAECPSEVYDDEHGEPLPVFCIWQSAAAARACRSAEWADFQVEAVSLNDFLHDWLIGFDQSEALVGVDFDSDLFGMEIEPVELLGDILDAAAQNRCTHIIEQYDDLMAYRLEWERLMAGQKHLN